MKIFYHRGDLDGKASAAVLRRKYPDAEFIGAEYGDTISAYVAKIIPGEDVIIVDYMFEPFSTMIGVSKKANLVWIDHHWAAIRQYVDAGKPFTAVVGKEDNAKAACELAWEYCFPTKRVPFTIKQLSLYDTWHHNNDEAILQFQYGAQLYLNDVNAPLWEELLNWEHNPTQKIVDIIDAGQVIMRYAEQNNRSMAKEYAFEIEFEGYKTLVMNTVSKGSQLFKSVATPEHKLRMVFCMTSNRQWKFSVYTEDPSIDCGALCAKHGGGGHKGAAGFVSPILPW